MIRFDVDWPAFWTRFAAGAAVGLVMGLCFWLSAGLGWGWVAVCSGSVGLIVGVFGAEMWQDIYQWWEEW